MRRVLHCGHSAKATSAVGDPKRIRWCHCGRAFRNHLNPTCDAIVTAKFAAHQATCTKVVNINTFEVPRD